MIAVNKDQEKKRQTVIYQRDIQSLFREALTAALLKTIQRMVILGDVPHECFALSSQIWNVSVARRMPRSTFTIEVSSQIESACRKANYKIFNLLKSIARFVTHRNHEAERRHVSTIQRLLWNATNHVSRKGAGTNTALSVSVPNSSCVDYSASAVECYQPRQQKRRRNEHGAFCLRP